MRLKWKKRACAVLTAACMALGAAPVFAADNNIEIVFTDVTATEPTTLTGEAKIMVSVKGAAGSATIAQTALDFSGDLKYKSISFLKGANDPENGSTQYAPPVSRTNAEKKLTPSVISAKQGLSFGDSEDLFVLTFSGDAGQTVTLNMNDLENTYCTVDGKDIKPDKTASITAAASAAANKSKTAAVRLVMDKVTDFTTKDFAKYPDRAVTLKITSEQKQGYTITTTLDDSFRDKTSTTPAFTMTNEVLDGDTYTVELSAYGYVSYIKNGVTFDDILEITNKEFIPGDIDGNGKADDEDKKLCQNAIDSGVYNEAADFNRDGKVDQYDLAVFGADDPTSTPTPTQKPSDNQGGSTGGGSGSGGSGAGTPTVTPTPGATPAPTSTVAPTPAANGSGNSSEANEEFTDLAGYDWAKNDIYFLKNKGVISGVSETEYAPANPIKRGDFVLMMVRMLNVTNEFTDNFADVPSDSYYYEAIGRAKAVGIAQGDGVNFNPENSITRQDLISIAYRAFLSCGYIEETADASSLDKFADKDIISDYAVGAMASMVSAGIIQGDGDSVNPLNNATRAEVAVMCARLVELME